MWEEWRPLVGLIWLSVCLFDVRHRCEVGGKERRRYVKLRPWTRSLNGLLEKTGMSGNSSNKRIKKALLPSPSKNLQEQGEGSVPPIWGNLGAGFWMMANTDFKLGMNQNDERQYFLSSHYVRHQVRAWRELLSPHNNLITWVHVGSMIISV